jgi:hypothetical protein
MMRPATYLVDVSNISPDRRKLTVVMHADVVGYSRLVGLDDAGTAARLRRMRREIIEPMIVQNGGIVRQTAGDSLLVLFDSIDGALQSAIAIQRAVPEFDQDAPIDRCIRFRIGINIGDAILATRPRPAGRTGPSSGCWRRSATGNARHRRRSPSPGCWRRSRGSSPSPAPPSSTASRTTSPRPQSSLRPTTFSTSTPLPHRSPW